MEKIKINALLDLTQTDFADIFEGCVYPHEILPLIKEYILKKGPTLGSGYTMIMENVWVGKNTEIAETAYIKGPAIIGHDVEIRQSAFIRGNAIIGNNSVIGNSTEIKNSFLFNKVQTPHFNYVGDSVLGFHAHIGAGVILSNVRSIPGNVKIHCEGETLETGLRKFSAILGDNAEIGCNSVLNPGTIIGRNSVVYPLSCVRGFVPENSIFKGNGRIAEKETR